MHYACCWCVCLFCFSIIATSFLVNKGEYSIRDDALTRVYCSSSPERRHSGEVCRLLLHLVKHASDAISPFNINMLETYFCIIFWSKCISLHVNSSSNTFCGNHLLSMLKRVGLHFKMVQLLGPADHVTLPTCKLFKRLTATHKPLLSTSRLSFSDTSPGRATARSGSLDDRHWSSPAEQ